MRSGNASSTGAKAAGSPKGRPPWPTPVGQHREAEIDAGPVDRLDPRIVGQEGLDNGMDQSGPANLHHLTEMRHALVASEDDGMRRDERRQLGMLGGDLAPTGWTRRADRRAARDRPSGRPRPGGRPRRGWR